MDPSAWPWWVKFLAGWGPLGVWAGIMTWAYFKRGDRADAAMAAVHARHDAEKAEAAKKFADVVATQAKIHRAEVAELNRHHETQLIGLANAFTKDRREAELAHKAQEDELVDRLVGAVQKQVDITGKVVAVVESLKKHGGGDDGPAT